MAAATPISGLYNVSPSKSGQTNSLTTWANNYGSQTSMYNGFLMNVSARGRNGLTVQGGINIGKTVTDNCEVQAVLPRDRAARSVLPQRSRASSPA